MRFGFEVVISALVLGIGFQSVFDFSLSTTLWLMVLAFGLSLLWRRKSFTFSSPVFLLISLFLLAFVVGVLRTEIHSWQFGISQLEDKVGESVSLTGVVVAEPDQREKSVHIYLKTDTDKILVTADRLTAVSYGDRVEVKGNLDRPESFTTDLGREFNYPKYLEAKGVEYRVSFAEVEVLESGLGNTVVSALLKAKKEFLLSLEKIIPYPSVGLGEGLLLGVKSSLGEKIETDFRKTGIIHIVVLSGYNVMLVVTFFMFCFSFFLSLRWRVVAGIVSIVCFALIVGLSATVVRASIMAGFVLLAQSMGRQYNVMRALLIAGIIMLFLNPYLLLYDIGFQLSFVATMGLILIVPKFESKSLEGKGVLGIREFFLATCATQVAVLPLLVYHIGEVSLIAVVVNVLVLPVVPVAMLLTFITGVAGFLSTSVAGIFGYLAMLSLQYILFVAGWFAGFPFASVVLPELSVVGVFSLYMAMTVIYIYLQKKNSHSDMLAGWEIVEEEERVSSLCEPTPQKELPIFFR